MSAASPRASGPISAAEAGLLGRRLGLALGVALGLALLSCGKPDEAEGEAPRAPAQPRPSTPDPGAKPPPPRPRVSSGRVYIPTYSHIYVREGVAEDLAVTLSVRNVSPEREIVLESVRYYDTAGRLIEDYLKTAAVLGPLETVEFFIPTQDRRGGSGANVIASWHADAPVVPPLMESVMVRTVATNQAYAFTTRGVEIPAEAALPQAPAPP